MPGAPHDLAAAYVLDALEADEARLFERHAGSCPVCLRTVDELRLAAVALAAAVPPAEPPVGLRVRVLAGTRRRTVVPLRRVVAAAAAIAAAVALAVALGHRGPETRSVALEGARGSLLVDGSRHGRLVIEDLAAAPAGRTYEAWVVDRDGAVPAGLFRGGGSPTVAVLFRRVPRGARVAVTVERAGGVARLRGVPVFRTGGTA